MARFSPSPLLNDSSAFSKIDNLPVKFHVRFRLLADFTFSPFSHSLDSNCSQRLDPRTLTRGSREAHDDR